MSHPLICRENYQNFIANGLVMQKWISMNKEFNGKDYTMVIEQIFPRDTIEKYYKRNTELVEKELTI